MKRSIVLAFVLGCAAHAARGQYIGLGVGARARVQTQAHPKWSYGHVVSWDSTGVLLDPCTACEGRNIPRAEIVRLEHSAGHAGRSYALEGLLVGGILGAVISVASAKRHGGYPSHNEMFGCVRSCAANVAAATGGLIGGVIGATAGAFFRREKWERVRWGYE